MLRREIDRRQKQQANASAGQLAAHAREIEGVKVVAHRVDQVEEDELKRIVDAVREDLRSGVVVLGATHDGRVRFVAGVTPDLVGRLHAGSIVRGVAGAAGGKGGGRPDFATGGGTQPERLSAALEETYSLVAQALAS